jgi:hypothetical protein
MSSLCPNQSNLPLHHDQDGDVKMGLRWDMDWCYLGLRIDLQPAERMTDCHDLLYFLRLWGLCAKWNQNPAIPRVVHCFIFSAKLQCWRNWSLKPRRIHSLRQGRVSTTGKHNWWRTHQNQGENQHQFFLPFRIKDSTASRYASGASATLHGPLSTLTLQEQYGCKWSEKLPNHSDPVFISWEWVRIGASEISVWSLPGVMSDWQHGVGWLLAEYCRYRLHLDLRWCKWSACMKGCSLAGPLRSGETSRLGSMDLVAERDQVQAAWWQ